MSSDNVKLIIEIDGDTYKDIKKGKIYSSVRDVPQESVLAIANGIPLDDVKAEMEKHQFSREYCCDHNIDTAIDMSMVRIVLDNVGKEGQRMICITGDTADELADLQTLLEAGMINSNVDTTLHVTYKLSSGGTLLVDQYDHIVRQRESEEIK